MSTSLRRQVGTYLGTVIPPGGWYKSIQELNKGGRIDFNALLTLFIILAEKVEEYEQTKPLQSG